jgi:hypothetical protein
LYSRRMAVEESSANFACGSLPQAKFALEVAQREEQQIGGHLRRVGEAHFDAAVGQRGARLHRHVTDGHLACRDGGAQGEGGLVSRLVPGRDHAPRVRVFELGEQGAPLALRAGALGRVVEREQADGLAADDARVVERQLVAAAR